MLTEPSHAGMSAGKNIYISVLISILNLRVKKTVSMCSIQSLAKTGSEISMSQQNKKLKVNLTEITWPLQVVGLVGSWPDHFLADSTCSCFKSCIESSRIVATTVSPCMEELPKATLHQCFMLSTTILVYSGAVPSLAATEPQR